MKGLFIYLKANERFKETEKASIWCTPRVAPESRAEPSLTQDPGTPAASATWWQEPKHLGHFPGLPRCIGHELHWKWSKQDLNHCTDDGTPALQEAG